MADGKKMPEGAWERIAWPDEYQQVLWRDWGTAFMTIDQLDNAINFYNRSLNLKADDWRALYLRSKCNLKIAQTDKALADSKAADSFKSKDVDIDIVKCRALYELNRFEDATVEMHDKTRIYTGRKVKDFNNLIIVLNEHFKDTLGESYGPFINNAARHFDELFKEVARRKHVETRPLWKILKGAGKCDVMSILEKEEELLSPREVARRERAFRVFNQMYLGQCWRDVVFLRDMKRNPTLCWQPSKVSAPFLKSWVDAKYATVKIFERMLHARSPLYNELMVKFGSKKKMDKNREVQLNYVQYDTHRNMITILRTIKKLRESGQVEKLSKYIEDAMGDYVVLKTNRVMPWKFEFINEVYNTLALAFADQYIKSPEASEDVPDQNRLMVILRLPTERKEKPAFVFGDKSTYQEPDAIDYPFIAYKNYLARLEKRLIFAKYPIERCYLLHQIARAHLKQNHFAECSLAARKSIEVVKLFNNQLWAFLGNMIIVKANAMVYKIENCYEALKEAHDLAINIKSPELLSFVKICQSYNDEDIAIRKRLRTVESGRSKRKSSRALSSSTTIIETESTETPTAENLEDIYSHGTN